MLLPPVGVMRPRSRRRDPRAARAAPGAAVLPRAGRLPGPRVRARRRQGRPPVPVPPGPRARVPRDRPGPGRGPRGRRTAPPAGAGHPGRGDGARVVPRPAGGGRRGDRRQTAGLALPGRRHLGLAQGPARRHERRPAHGPGRPGGRAPGPARTAPRRQHRDHLAPAQAREVGAPAGGRAGALADDPEHGPVRPVDPPLPVELRQVAGRHGTPAFVRVRPEGQPPRATALLRTVHGAKRPQPGLRARPVSPVRRRERPCGAHLLPGTALTGKAAWQC